MDPSEETEVRNTAVLVEYHKTHCSECGGRFNDQDPGNVEPTPHAPEGWLRHKSCPTDLPQIR